MQKICAILFLSLSLAACETPEYDASHYVNDPAQRMVNIDDHKIYVVPTGGDRYIAWGGSDDRDGRVQYRQLRAVELTSKCRVDKVTSKKTSDVFRGSVKC